MFLTLLDNAPTFPFAWHRYDGNKVLIGEKLGMSRSKLYRDLIKYDIA